MSADPVAGSRLVIWDLDGTLVDSRHDLAGAANVGRQAIGLPALPLETVVGYVGNGLTALIERLTPGIDPATRARCRAAFEVEYARTCTVTTACFPGIHEAMDRLSGAGYVHAIATNKPRAFTLAIAASCGLAQRTIGVRAGDDGPTKPDPWSLRDLMAQAGAVPATTWMVGDHHTDIRAARAAGVRVVFCGWGIGHADGDIADGVAAHPAAVAERILKG